MHRELQLDKLMQTEPERFSLGSFPFLCSLAAVPLDRRTFAAHDDRDSFTPIGALMNRVLQPRPLVVLGRNVWMGTAAGADATKLKFDGGVSFPNWSSKIGASEAQSRPSKPLVIKAVKDTPSPWDGI
jgi:hypothetical protein